MPNSNPLNTDGNVQDPSLLGAHALAGGPSAQFPLSNLLSGFPNPPPGHSGPQHGHRQRRHSGPLSGHSGLPPQASTQSGSLNLPPPPGSMAQLHADMAARHTALEQRLDDMTVMFTQLKARMPGPAPNVAGWPPEGQVPVITQANSTGASPSLSASQQAGFGAQAATLTPGRVSQAVPTAFIPPTTQSGNAQASGLAAPVPGAHPGVAPVQPGAGAALAAYPPIVTGGARRSARSGTDSESSRAGRNSVRSRAAGRIQAPRDPSTGDEGDEYADNRRNPEAKHTRKIETATFSPTDKEQDFSVWVNQFEEAVNRAVNPHSLRRHHLACKRWISSLLSADAYSIWSRAVHKNGDWTLLKRELELAFEDGSIRAEWKTNMQAYVWDEHGQSLQAYCAKVKRLVDTFETEMAGCPAAKHAAYFTRFLTGLPPDYVQHVKLSLPTTSSDVDKARDVCIQFQSCKRLKAKSEVGANVTFQDATVPARVTKNETDIIRLGHKLEKLERTEERSSHHTKGSTSYAGRSPYRQPSSGGSSRDNSSSRMEDRMSRFRQRNDRFRGDHRGQRRGNFNRNQRFSRANDFQRPGGSTDNGVSVASSAVEDLDPLNDTLAFYQEMKEREEEEDYQKFCQLKDRQDSENF